MDKQKAANILQKQLDEVQDLRELNPDDPTFKLWKENCLTIFKEIFPDQDDWHYNFSWSAFRINRIKTIEESGYYSPEDKEAYEEGLQNAEVTIKAALNKLELFGYTPQSVSENKSGDSHGITIQITNNLQNEQTVNLTVNFDQIFQYIDSLDTEEQEKQSAKDKVKELQDELEDENPSWEKVRNALIWLLNFSREVFLKVLPYILEKYSHL